MGEEISGTGTTGARHKGTNPRRGRELRSPFYAGAIFSTVDFKRNGNDIILYCIAGRHIPEVGTALPGQ